MNKNNDISLTLLKAIWMYKNYFTYSALCPSESESISIGPTKKETAYTMPFWKLSDSICWVEVTYFKILYFLNPL